METLNPLMAGLQRHKEKVEQMKNDGTYVAPIKLNPIQRAKEDPNSLRKAITGKCYECVGMGEDANFRETIKTCTSFSCPLYPVRPYQNKK